MEEPAKDTADLSKGPTSRPALGRRLPFQVGVAVVRVDEQRRSHFGIAQRHDAVDVAVVHGVEVEALLQHDGDLHGRRLIRHRFHVDVALLAVGVLVHGVQQAAEGALLGDSPQFDTRSKTSHETQSTTKP